MTRQQYLDQLKTNLWRLPSSERDDVLVYYQELFDEQAIQPNDFVPVDFRTPEEVAREVLSDITLDVPADYMPTKPTSIWVYVGIGLVILIFFPIWFIAPLAIVLGGLASLMALAFLPLLILFQSSGSLGLASILLLIGASAVGLALLLIIIPLAIQFVKRLWAKWKARRV